MGEHVARMMEKRAYLWEKKLNETAGKTKI
jgi:hypothetical protein